MSETTETAIWEYYQEFATTETLKNQIKVVGGVGSSDIRMQLYSDKTVAMDLNQMSECRLYCYKMI